MRLTRVERNVFDCLDWNSYTSIKTICAMLKMTNGTARAHVMNINSKLESTQFVLFSVYSLGYKIMSRADRDAVKLRWAGRKA